MLIKKYFNLNKFFYLGIFLLASAPAFAAIIFLISNLISSTKRQNSYFKDYWNLPFFLMGFLMIVSCLILTFKFDPLNSKLKIDSFIEIYDRNLLWIGLSNWLPYFWLFWSSQYFTFISSQRKKIGQLLLFGSIPVIFTGILQYFFKLHGPFTFLNGLITWYLKPVDSYNGLSGLFSNANYTGIWLALIWPFSIANFIEKKNTSSEKVISFLLLILIFICTFLTFSRNAWIGLLIGMALSSGTKFIKIIFPIITTFSIPILTSIGLIPNDFLIEESRKIVPSIFWNYKFANIGINSISNFGRIEIWTYAINLIYDQPIWGWGSGSFPILFKLKTELYKGHTHNILLELGLSFGLLTLVLFIIAIILLITYSYTKKIYRENDDNNENYETAWRSSFIIILSSQMLDIQYFDLRIGIVFWLLLGGLRNFIK